MDIVSYSKAMQGRKNLDSLNKRLGVGDYKSGDKDVKGTFANVKARLDELEKKRQGLIDKMKVVSVQEGSITNGVWTSNIIHLGEDALELKALKVTGSLMSKSENLAKGGIASASSSRSVGDNYNPAKAFDGMRNEGRGWQSSESATFPHWIMYDWTTIAKIVNRYKIRARNNPLYINQSPKNWTLRGLTLDGQTWVDLDTQVNQVNWGEYEEREFFFENNVAYRAYVLVVSETNGFQEGEVFPVNIDELEFYFGNDVPAELPRDKVKVSVKTTDDFIDVGNNFEIVSKFSKNLQIQVTVLDEVYKLNNVAISYQNRPLPNRVSDLETSIHINLNKHNLRVSSLLDKKRYNMKDMIIDDFGDTSGIDLINSKNILHDQQNHKVVPKDKTQAAILIATVESLETVPTLFLLSSVTEDNAEDNLEYYVSRNNEAWMRIEKDKLVSLDKLPEGKELLVKVVLKNGKELHAISYSWL